MFGIDSGNDVKQLSEKWKEDESEGEEDDEIEEDMEHETEFKIEEKDIKARKQDNGLTEAGNVQVILGEEMGQELRTSHCLCPSFPLPVLCPLTSHFPVPFCSTMMGEKVHAC